ncbi:MAG: methylmalonyl Co-A mutase-associated GTPase MeaB [Acidobacteria bacterium]|nr:methylmalonyl Co-A mutase-associated GTPase MeaB [Acidobacteriota bacterium]MCL5287831.1 methylmalonyl Co-A mutase-associated GTPase MeaB [Acidobacteriota bacterium]
MSVTADNWVEKIRAGDVRAISRAITAIENQEPAAEGILRQLFPDTGQAYLIGITGSPGTGKSTLVDRLATRYRKQQLPVGIVAVDPSSPFSGGAILGDRIRMQGHATDNGMFIRSMATRGFLGGLARTTADVALLLDAAGKRVILVETVGVGQDEVDIVKLADCTLVVLMPGSGDEVQAIKAGIMEIGDIFVLNKSDREGADRFEQELTAMLSLAPERDGWRPPVVRTVATEDKGTAELTAAIEKFRAHFSAAERRDAKSIERWKQRLLELLQARLMQRVAGEGLGEAALGALAAQIAGRKKDPYSAVSEILARVGLK